MKARFLHTVKVVTFFILLAGLMSCHERVVNPYEPHPVLVKEIAVANEFEFGRLEIEVHIVDAVTGRLLGCAGANSGLRQVDTVDVVYYVDADFMRPEGGLLYIEDIEDREIEIWVIEDDEAECPGPFLPDEDDIVGISRAIAGYQLGRDIEMHFDDVLHLRLGI